MSVMQVVGSSRINNTIYLSVGYVYWTWFLQVTGFPLNVTIETALVVIPIAAVIGTVLWAFQFEHNLVERIFYLYTKRGRRGKMFRVWIARTYLVIMPWESTYDIQPSIMEMQKREVGRVIKSETLHQEFEDLYQLFWIIAITPPLMHLLSGTMLWLQGFVLLASTVVILIIALPIVHRKRGIAKQTLQFAFFRWLYETISRDIENRTTDSRFLRFPDKLQKLRDGLQRASLRIVELAQRKDWDGFTLNVEHFEPILEKSLPSYFSEFDYNRVIKHWAWLVRTSLEDTLLYESISVGLEILEATLDTLQQPKKMYLYLELKRSESSFLNRMKSVFFGISIRRITRLNLKLRLFEKGIRYLTLESETDWDPLRIFRIISKETIRFLERETVQNLCTLLYLFTEQNIPDLSSLHTENENGVVELVEFLLRAIEDGIGDKYSDRVTPSVEKTFLCFPLLAHHWGVRPLDYMSSCGPITIHCFLENDIGQTANEILRWMDHIVKVAEKLDFEASAQLLLQKFNESNFRELIAELDSIRNYGSMEQKKQVDSLTEALLAKLNEDPKDTTLLILRGLYHEENGRKEMAKTAYLEAAKIDKANLKYVIELGKSILDYSHRYSYGYDEEACLLFKEAIPLCEVGDEFHTELVDLASEACTTPSQDNDDDDDWYE